MGHLTAVADLGLTLLKRRGPIEVLAVETLALVAAVDRRLKALAVPGTGLAKWSVKTPSRIEDVCTCAYFFKQRLLLQWQPDECSKFLVIFAWNADGFFSSVDLIASCRSTSWPLLLKQSRQLQSWQYRLIAKQSQYLLQST